MSAVVPTHMCGLELFVQDWKIVIMKIPSISLNRRLGNAWRLPEEFWVQERVQRSLAEKSWQAVLRHQVRAPSHFTRRGRCWAHKASSPAHCRSGASRWASLPGFAKTGFANNCEYQGKVRIISAKYRAFRSKTSSRTYGEMHPIASHFADFRPYSHYPP